MICLYMPNIGYKRALQAKIVWAIWYFFQKTLPLTFSPLQPKIAPPCEGLTPISVVKQVNVKIIFVMIQSEINTPF